MFKVPWALPFTHPASLIATWFGAGLMPRLPGTWGSLAALPFAWVLVERFGPEALMIAALLAFVAGLWASGRVLAAAPDRPDPPAVVIDEVAAQWLVLVAVPLDAGAYILAFALFRLFDIWKPWPIRTIETSLPPALGIMADDVAAALYAALGFLLLQPVLAHA